jgi:Amidohydrolase
VAGGLLFSLNKNGGLKRTIKEYIRENFYGGILAGEYVGQEPGAIDKSWSLSYQAYLGMANAIGVDRVLFTTDYPYGDMKAARQYFDQMPINVNDKEKIAHLNAERLLGLGGPSSRCSASRRMNEGSPVALRSEICRPHVADQLNNAAHGTDP